jgi:hypothetical protein
MLYYDGAIGGGVDGDEFLAVFCHRHEIVAGQIGGGRRAIQALLRISLNKGWRSSWSMGGFDPGVVV